jgi:hypothetical protein
MAPPMRPIPVMVRVKAARAPSFSRKRNLKPARVSENQLPSPSSGRSAASLGGMRTKRSVAAETKKVRPLIRNASRGSPSRTSAPPRAGPSTNERASIWLQMPFALTRSSSSPTTAGKTEFIAGLKRLESAVAKNTSGKAIHKVSFVPAKSTPTCTPRAPHQPRS